MSIRKRRSDRSGRAPLPSPGRPPVAGRDERRRFWAAIAAGLTSEDAAVEPACRSRSEPDGSGRRAACHQRCSDPRRSRSPDGISRLRSARRSRFFAFRAIPCRRSDVGSVGRLRRSPVSCGATRPPAAAAWSIARRRPSGTPSDRPVARSRRSLRSTRLAHLCGGTAGRHDRRSERRSRSRPCRVLEGTPTWPATGSTMGQRMEPGADRPALAGRLPG